MSQGGSSCNECKAPSINYGRGCGGGGGSGEGCGVRVIMIYRAGHNF